MFPQTLCRGPLLTVTKEVYFSDLQHISSLMECCFHSKMPGVLYADMGFVKGIRFHLDVSQNTETNVYKNTLSQWEIGLKEKEHLLSGNQMFPTTLFAWSNVEIKSSSIAFSLQEWNHWEALFQRLGILCSDIPTDSDLHTLDLISYR